MAHQTRRQFLHQALLGSIISGLTGIPKSLRGARHSIKNRSGPSLTKSHAPRSGTQSRPNIVFILADCMGYGDIGPYGVKDISTPHLDRLARQGVRLTDCYANGPTCTPTRASLLTGRYPQRAGLEINVNRKNPSRGLPVSETSIARMLKDNGYATALFGKWHLGYTPEFSPIAHGFDEFFGILDWTVDYYSHKNIEGQPALYEGAAIVERKGYLTDLITERAESFIDQNKDRPFFLFVSYNAPLPPYQPPDRPDDVRTAKTWKQGTRKDYSRMVERVDLGAGRILKALEKHNLENKTLVIFTVDHGGEELSCNEPFFHHFSTLWEGGIRVPCLLRWPGILPAGAVSHQPVITTDLTASIISATGSKAPAERSLDGMNILPILSGENPEVERTFFWRRDTPSRRQKAVRKGKWKYLEDAYIEFLFDIEKDFSERKNLAYRHPGILKQMQDLVKKWEAEMAKTSTSSEVR